MQLRCGEVMTREVHHKMLRYNILCAYDIDIEGQLQDIRYIAHYNGRRFMKWNHELTFDNVMTYSMGDVGNFLVVIVETLHNFKHSILPIT